MAKRALENHMVRELLRLSFEVGLSNRKVGQSLRIPRQTVGDYVRRAQDAALTWDRIQNLDDTQLRAILLPYQPPSEKRPLPSWLEVREELVSHKGVTLRLLWEEYRERYPDGYEYSRFCDYYRKWRKTIDISMRQEHKAGEKVFVDYAGTTVPVFDKELGCVREASIYVAVLGASNYAYSEASWSKTTQDWVEAHVRAFEFFEGVPLITVPDNLKAGVIEASLYDPGLNRSYAEMATHYRTTIMPARVNRPKDKAKVEVGVQVVTRWILARLRKRTFLSLAALNREIRHLLKRMNERPFQKLPGCRRSRYETVDRPALKPLPRTRFVHGEWTRPKVHIDYHVQVDKHFYSVPYEYRGRIVDVRATARTIEVFSNGKRIASHIRSFLQWKPTTLPEHMPSAHRKFKDWSPERFKRWADRIGRFARVFIETILEREKLPEQSYRKCLGILTLGKKYGDDRLEAACERAVSFGSFYRKAVVNILKNNLDRDQRRKKRDTKKAIVNHQNIRGPDHYAFDESEEEDCFPTKETQEEQEEECCIIPLFRSSTSSG